MTRLSSAVVIARRAIAQSLRERSPNQMMYVVSPYPRWRASTTRD